MRQRTITDEDTLKSLLECGVEVYHRFCGDRAERQRPCNNKGMLGQWLNPSWMAGVRKSLREQAYYIYVE